MSTDDPRDREVDPDERWDADEERESYEEFLSDECDDPA